MSLDNLPNPHSDKDMNEFVHEQVWDSFTEKFGEVYTEASLELTRESAYTSLESVGLPDVSVPKLPEKVFEPRTSGETAAEFINGVTIPALKKTVQDPNVQLFAAAAAVSSLNEAGKAFSEGDHQTGGLELAKSGGAGLVLSAGIITTTTSTVVATIGSTIFVVSGAGVVIGLVVFGGAVIWNNVKN